MSDLKIEKVAIKDLKFDPENARKHSERQLKAICHSLSEFGQRKPIVIGSDLVVYAGNGQLEAAIALNWKEILVTKLPFDEPAKCRAYAIADNRTSDLATWDNEALLASLEQISDADLLETVGYNATEIDDLKALLEEGASKDAGQQGIIYSTPASVLKDRYEGREERQIVLGFKSKQFIWVVERLQALREDNGMETNSEAIIQLLSAHYNETAPE